MLASKAEHLDIEAARSQNLLRDMDAAEEREARSVHELEAEQERLNARTYELDAELRQIQNLLGQTALDLDRARKPHHVQSRAGGAARIARVSSSMLEIEQAERSAAELGSAQWRLSAHRWRRCASKRRRSKRSARVHRQLPPAWPSRNASKRAWRNCANWPRRLVEESARDAGRSAAGGRSGGASHGGRRAASRAAASHAKCE